MSMWAVPTLRGVRGSDENGICPKCTSREVFHHAGSKFAHEMIALKGDLISKGAAPDKYLCLDCGYLEYYLPVTADVRQTVLENWDRVPTK